MDIFQHATARVIALMSAILIAAVTLTAVGRADPAAALSSTDWDPGEIISDSLFYDGGAMSRDQIQAFLNARIGACATNGCLNVLTASALGRDRQVSSVTGQLICDALPGGAFSAATLIYNAQVACGISAKVILVTLQKEQGLVSGSFARAPSQRALDRAMGMACPDTAPCASYALGFGNQIYYGVRQLKVYKAGRFARQPGVQSVQYSPTTSCGSSTVNVRNYATAALYNYTPYQPNAAALANLRGSGNSCSSYGNRNFWVYYTDWFGSTRGLPSADEAPTLLARDASGRLVQYLGTGKGGWQTPKAIGTGWNSMTAITGAGDFDGDGYRDVVARDASGVLWLYPMLGEGRFGSRRQIADGWNAMTDVLAGQDVNGDGVQDLVARDEAGALWLYPGTGRGRVTTRIQIGWGWSGFTALVEVGDFSGDGTPDLIGRDAKGLLWLYPGTGSGYLGARRLIGSDWNRMTAITSPGDFDGDGTTDILARDQAGMLYLYSGSGRGSVWRTVRVGSGWGGMEAVIGGGARPGRIFAEAQGAGDLDSDGARDVLAVTARGTASLYRGNGASGWRGSVSVPGDWSGITLVSGAGDFDGDGTLDVIGRDAAGGLWLYPGTGTSTGVFGARRQIGSAWNGFSAVLGAGDVTGDGSPDVLAQGAEGALLLYPGDGRGGFLPSKVVGSGWNVMTAVVNVGDFDGDGWSDLVARDRSGALWLYPGTGNAGWFERRRIGSGWNGMTAIVGPGDFTGDGTPDVLARDARGAMWLYPGNGSGGFSASRQVGSGWSGMRLIG